jgi:Ca2+-binding RTX toxin-like protein
VQGTTGNDTLKAPSGAGQNNKYDGKQGNDVIIASTGDDLLIGGDGSDYLFGGQGADTFEFSKFAHAGDTDYVTDFNLSLGDSLKLGAGTTITGAAASYLSAQEFNGQSLHNDANVYDLTLTLHVDDGVKSFDYTVTLMDVIKNQTFSADQFNSYLNTLGYSGGIDFGAA